MDYFFLGGGGFHAAVCEHKLSAVEKLTVRDK